MHQRRTFDFEISNFVAYKKRGLNMMSITQYFYFCTYMLKYNSRENL